jgi:cysteine-rich repeat protein
VGGSLEISGNNALPQCEADALASQVTKACTDLEGQPCFGNNGTGTCQCGDNVQNLGEGCDDGNIIPGDGCSDVCAVE